eukprot:jgi/Botrbrau1/2725/Bobra.0164s0005.1
MIPGQAHMYSQGLPTEGNPSVVQPVAGSTVPSTGSQGVGHTAGIDLKDNAGIASVSLFFDQEGQGALSGIQDFEIRGGADGAGKRGGHHRRLASQQHPNCNAHAGPQQRGTNRSGLRNVRGCNLFPRFQHQLRSDPGRTVGHLGVRSGHPFRVRGAHHGLYCERIWIANSHYPP